MYNPLQNCAYTHSCYVPASNNIHGIDAVVVAAKDVDTLESKLQIIQNPKIKVWVAKQGTRTYEKKRECVKFSELDMYVTEYKRRGEIIAKALGKNTYGYINVRTLLESPYVYGADISPEITIKAEYTKNVTKAVKEYNIGIMDIETSVLGDEQIILNGYCDWKTRQLRCWILASWFQPSLNWEQELMDRYHKEFQTIYAQLNDKAKAVFHPDEWTVKFELCATEKELIWNSIRYVVLAKPDFLGSWNSAYEGGYIPKRAQFRGIDIVEICRSITIGMSDGNSRLKVIFIARTTIHLPSARLFSAIVRSEAKLRKRIYFILMKQPRAKIRLIKAIIVGHLQYKISGIGRNSDILASCQSAEA